MTKYITDKPIAQGDVLFVPIDAIPADAKPAIAKDGYYVVAKSETHHDHVIDCTRAEVYESADDEFIAYIRSLDDGAEIEHQRDFDTHETVALRPKQAVRIHRQREWAPEGFRRAQD